jgi:hypothetical protein
MNVLYVFHKIAFVPNAMVREAALSNFPFSTDDCADGV